MRFLRIPNTGVLYCQKRIPPGRGFCCRGVATVLFAVAHGPHQTQTASYPTHKRRERLSLNDTVRETECTVRSSCSVMKLGLKHKRNL
jgi:hypothetical protein